MRRLMDKLLPHSVERSIVRALALGDVVDSALTLFEVWQQLEGTATLDTVRATLENLVEKKVIVTHRGRYALLGRGVLLSERPRRYRASVSKWRRARWFLAVLAALPGVRSVGFYNTLGYGNARLGSDIDIVVIAKEQWIWRVRLVSVFLAEIFGHRPKQGKVRDALCLSFFFTPSADLSQVKRSDDPFLVWWLTRLNIVADASKAYQRWQANNEWIKKERPNIATSQAAFFLPERAMVFLKPFMRIIFSPLLLVSDAHVRRFSEKFGSKTLWNAAATPDTSVVMQDDLLKLHLTDRRDTHAREFTRRFERAMKYVAV